MTFPGYPLPADWTNESTMLDDHAAQSNAVEAAANDLQEQIATLSALVASQASQISSIQAIINQFNSAWPTYTPTLYNVTVGTGSRQGEYLKVGRLLILRASFVLGSGFTMSGSSPLGIGLPSGVTAVAAAGRYPVINAWANNSNYRTGGSGVVLNTESDRISRFANESSLLGWKQGEPFTWGAGDGLTVTAVLQTTA